MLENLLKGFIIIVFLNFTLISCSKSEEEEKPLGYLQEESNIPDYDNDPIYSKANPKNLPTYWDIFVESAALYGVDLSDITV